MLDKKPAKHTNKEASSPRGASATAASACHCCSELAPNGAALLTLLTPTGAPGRSRTVEVQHPDLQVRHGVLNAALLLRGQLADVRQAPASGGEGPKRLRLGLASPVHLQLEPCSRQHGQAEDTVGGHLRVGLDGPVVNPHGHHTARPQALRQGSDDCGEGAVERVAVVPARELDLELQGVLLVGLFHLLPHVLEESPCFSLLLLAVPHTATGERLRSLLRVQVGVVQRLLLLPARGVAARVEVVNVPHEADLQASPVGRLLLHPLGSRFWVIAGGLERPQDVPFRGRLGKQLVDRLDPVGGQRAPVGDVQEGLRGVPVLPVHGGAELLHRRLSLSAIKVLHVTLDFFVFQGLRLAE
mmetsp:Transcript_64087/g.177826  ORF Transcript_64087/g.177826 Transcript_64087/m.177826 type:complete len:357 (+) Transcript_64087:232-1302(+)